MTRSRNRGFEQYFFRFSFTLNFSVDCTLEKIILLPLVGFGHRPTCSM